MSRVLLTVSAVIRTPCRTGWPPPEPALRVPLSGVMAPVGSAAAVRAAPKAGVAVELVPVGERGAKPFEDEPLLLPFRDRRSALDAYVPEPGAIWLLAASSEAEDDAPMNISVSTRAIWRASPYFTR